MQAIIFVGIQGSGKSSFYRERFCDTHVRINLDMLRTRHREQLLLRACLEMKQSFVVDNTNPHIEDRARYIPLAKAAGFHVIGYYFETTLDDALRRNAQRPGKARIPEKGIRGVYNRLILPSLEEGFDELYKVGLVEPQAFVVERQGEEQG